MRWQLVLCDDVTAKNKLVELQNSYHGYT